MDEAVFSYTEAFLASRGALVVYVTPPTHVVARNLAARVEAGGELGLTPPLAEVICLFDDAHARRHTVTWRLTYDFHLGIAERLVEQASYVERHAASLSDYATYVGPPQPRRLLVGDVRGGDDGDGLLPAFTPYPSTSGHYLLRALVSDELRSTGIINANDADDVLSFVREVCPGAPVVALGRRAHRTLDRLGVAHGTVPHPQYVRRFFFHHHDDYASVISQTFDTGVNNLAWRPKGTWLDRIST